MTVNDDVRQFQDAIQPNTGQWITRQVSPPLLHLSSFCGVKIETDHLVPRVEGGTDDIDNCLPVCWLSHAEIHSYNDQHPRGRKFRPEELRAHKDQWLEICSTRPEVFTEPSRGADVGPLQALIDELEFNAGVAKSFSGDDVGCHFYDEQFRRAIQFGAISVVREDLKRSINQAYLFIGKANHVLQTWSSSSNYGARANMQQEVIRTVKDASPKIDKALAELLKFLGRETDW